MTVYEAIASIFKFFSDKTVGWGKKIFYIILLAIGFYVVNGILGLSTFSFTNKKVETIKNINEILKDGNLDTNVRKTLQRELLVISRKKSLQESIYDFFSPVKNKARTDTKITTIAKDRSISEVNIYWSILTASGIFIIGGLLTSFRKENWQYLKQGFWGVIKFIVFNIIGNVFLWYIVFLIINAMPTIRFTNDSPMNKYISNVVYQLGIFGFLLMLIIYIMMGVKGKTKKN